MEHKVPGYGQADVFDSVLTEILSFRQQLARYIPRGNYLLAQNVFLLVASSDSRGGVTIKEITNSFGSSPNSPRYHLDYYIKSELFLTVPDANDSRVKRVLLSESGKRIKKLIQQDLNCFFTKETIQEFINDWASMALR